MHSDTGSTTGVTAAALARVEAARKRAIWADDFMTLNAYRPGKTRMEMREIRADLATDSARAELAQLVADVPLLAAISAAAVQLVAFAAERNGDWPWWGWTGEDGAGCIGCLADDDDLDDPIGFTDDWSTFPHADDCAAMQLDAAIRAAGEAGGA